MFFFGGVQVNQKEKFTTHLPTERCIHKQTDRQTDRQTNRHLTNLKCSPQYQVQEPRVVVQFENVCAHWTGDPSQFSGRTRQEILCLS